MTKRKQGRSGDGRRRNPEPIERYVGSRIRLRRKALGMSQEGLAATLGVSYQQIQKYETGMCRIGASRLHMMASALGVPVSTFFPPTQADGAPPAEVDPTAVMELLSSADAIELCLAAMQVGDPNVRRELIQLVQSIALTFEEAAPRR